MIPRAGAPWRVSRVFSRRSVPECCAVCGVRRRLRPTSPAGRGNCTARYPFDPAFRKWHVARCRRARESPAVKDRRHPEAAAGGTPLCAAVMNFRKVSAGSVPPVTFFIGVAVVIAEPDACHQVGRIAGKQRIARIVGGSGLAGNVPALDHRCLAGALRQNRAKHCVHHAKFARADDPGCVRSLRS